jgi:hypothetical protein
VPTANGDGLYAGEENKTASFDVHVGNRNGDFGVKIGLLHLSYKRSRDSTQNSDLDSPNTLHYKLIIERSSQYGV